MKINDRRSLARLDFAEPVKAKDLQQEIATVARDTTVTLFGGMMSPNDDTLATRGGGQDYKIYDQIERDCHAFAVLQKRKLAVTSREWQVFPGGETPADAEAAEEVKRQVDAMNFDQLSENLLDAVLKGFAVGEIIWAVQDDRLTATNVKARSQRRFTFMEDGGLRLKTPQNPLPGIALPERKFIVHRFGAKDDNPYGLGLGTRLFWPVWFKRQGITFWLTFCDKFGSPTVVGKYPAGTPKPERDNLLSACYAVQREAGIIIPEGMMLEFLEAARSGNITTYETLARYMDEQISEAVLGETGSTNQSGDGGSRARDEVGNEVRLEIAKADADALCATLNATLVRWIVDLNSPGAAYPQVWRIFPENLSAIADVDKKLYEIGFEPDEEYIEQTYGRKWKKRAAAPSPAPAQADFAERDLPARIARLADRSQADQDTLATAAKKLAGDYETILGKRLDELKALLDETDDLVTFKKRLAELIRKTPPEIAAALDKATFSARLMGRTSGSAK